MNPNNLYGPQPYLGFTIPRSGSGRRHPPVLISQGPLPVALAPVTTRRRYLSPPLPPPSSQYYAHRRHVSTPPAPPPPPTHFGYGHQHHHRFWTNQPPPAPTPVFDPGSLQAFAYHQNVDMERLRAGDVPYWREVNHDPFVPAQPPAAQWLPARVDNLDTVSGCLDSLGHLNGPVPAGWNENNPYKGVSRLCGFKFDREPTEGIEFESAIKDIKRAHMLMQLKAGTPLKDLLPMDMTAQEVDALVNHLVESAERELGQGQTGGPTRIPNPSAQAQGVPIPNEYQTAQQQEANTAGRLNHPTPFGHGVAESALQDDDSEDWEQFSREIHALVLGMSGSSPTSVSAQVTDTSFDSSDHQIPQWLNLEEVRRSRVNGLPPLPRHDDQVAQVNEPSLQVSQASKFYELPQRVNQPPPEVNELSHQLNRLTLMVPQPSHLEQSAEQLEPLPEKMNGQPQEVMSPVPVPLMTSSPVTGRRLSYAKALSLGPPRTSPVSSRDLTSTGSSLTFNNSMESKIGLLPTTPRGVRCQVMSDAGGSKLEKPCKKGNGWEAVNKKHHRRSKNHRRRQPTPHLSAESDTTTGFGERGTRRAVAKQGSSEVKVKYVEVDDDLDPWQWQWESSKRNKTRNRRYRKLK